MDTREAAQKWNLNLKTVQRYCQRKLIPGTTQNKAGQYLIPDDARPPYLPRRLKNRDAAADKWDVLCALFQNRTLSAQLLQISAQRLEDTLAALCEKNLIRLRQPGSAPDTLGNYRLTDEGISLMDGRKPRNAVMRFLDKKIELVMEKGTEVVVKAALPPR